MSTDRPHQYQAGYLVEMRIVGIDARNRLHAGPTRVQAVTGPCTFTVHGRVPAKISGEPLQTLLGRSKVCRVNGSFVTDVNWAALVAALRAEFAAKFSALERAVRVTVGGVCARCV
jgi:hypothetical protein